MKIIKSIKNCEGCARRRAKMKKAVNGIIIPKLNIYSKRLSMWQEKLWREVNGKSFMGIIDNVAGRKTFEYTTFGRSGVQQSNSKLLTIRPEVVVTPPQQMTAACVWNASNAISGVDGGLTTQIDRGRDNYGFDDDSVPATCYAYGYAVNTEWYLTTGASFGSIDDDTYVDGTSTSRTIKGVVYTESCAGHANSDDFHLSLDGINIGNNDNTWLDMTWDDTAGTPRTLTRLTDATSYTASLNGSTHWRDQASPYSWADQDLNTDFIITTS